MLSWLMNMGFAGGDPPPVIPPPPPEPGPDADTVVLFTAQAGTGDNPWRRPLAEADPRTIEPGATHGGGPGSNPWRK